MVPVHGRRRRPLVAMPYITTRRLCCGQVFLSRAFVVAELTLFALALESSFRAVTTPTDGVMCRHARRHNHGDALVATWIARAIVAVVQARSPWPCCCRWRAGESRPSRRGPSASRCACTPCFFFVINHLCVWARSSSSAWRRLLGDTRLAPCRHRRRERRRARGTWRPVARTFTSALDSEASERHSIPRPSASFKHYNSLSASVCVLRRRVRRLGMGRASREEHPHQVQPIIDEAVYRPSSASARCHSLQSSVSAER